MHKELADDAWETTEDEVEASVEVLGSRGRGRSRGRVRD